MERGRPERPLDDASGPVRELAASLRMLRAAAGNPSYRTMAATAHFSPATLARAAAGHRLPSLDVTVAYAIACGASRAEWEQRWRDCAKEAAQPDTEDGAAGASLDDVVENQPLPQPHWSRLEHMVWAPMRWRTRRNITALAVVMLVAAAVLLGTGAISDDPSQTIPTSVPAAVPAANANAPNAPNAPNAQAMGRACNKMGIIAPMPVKAGSPQGQARVRMSFEAGFKLHSLWAPWWGFSNVVEGLTTSHAYDGKQSLSVRIVGQDAAIGTTHIAGLTSGGTITVHIWYGGQGSGYICPYAQDKQSSIQWVPQQPLQLMPSQAPGWRTYTWTMPPFDLLGTGIQLTKTSASDFVVLLDAVTW